MKKHKKQISEQNKAVSSLSLISAGETGYLQDWALINEIREQDYQQSKQLQCNKPERQQKQQQKCLKTNRQVTPNRRTIFNIRQQRILHHDANEGKKFIQVRVQNFVTISYNRRVSMMRKYDSQRKMLYRSQENVQSTLEQIKNQNNTDHNLNEKPASVSRYENTNRQIPNSSMNYIQKIRKLSLPWIKHIPKVSPKKSFKQQQIQRQKEQARRLTQIIKNKIRRKRSNKFIIQKQTLEGTITQLSTNQNQNIQTREQDTKQIQEYQKDSSNNQIRLLKSWLQLNRHKNKKSITTLLRQHFENKYFEKKKQRQKTMRDDPPKFIAIIPKQNK